MGLTSICEPCEMHQYHIFPQSYHPCTARNKALYNFFRFQSLINTFPRASLAKPFCAKVSADHLCSPEFLPFTSTVSPCEVGVVAELSKGDNAERLEPYVNNNVALVLNTLHLTLYNFALHNGAKVPWYTFSSSCTCSGVSVGSCHQSCPSQSPPKTLTHRNNSSLKKKMGVLYATLRCKAHVFSC